MREQSRVTSTARPSEVASETAGSAAGKAGDGDGAAVESMTAVSPGGSFQRDAVARQRTEPIGGKRHVQRLMRPAGVVFLPEYVDRRLASATDANGGCSEPVPSDTAAAVAYWYELDPHLHPAQIAARIGRSERTVRRYWPPPRRMASPGRTHGDGAPAR
jgi:hypothetical protein